MDYEKEIRNAHAEAMAVQMLLIGLMNGLTKHGIPKEVINEAFDFAADAAISGSLRTGHPQSTRTLEIIDQLRESIVSRDAP